MSFNNFKLEHYILYSDICIFYFEVIHMYWMTGCMMYDVMIYVSFIHSFFLLYGIYTQNIGKECDLLAIF